MATLYKRGDSQFYQATLTNYRGERRRVSLKTGSKREANRRLRVLLEEEGKEDVMTETDAAYLIRKLRGEIGSVTIRGWLSEWVEDICKPTVSWATFRAYKNAAGKLCAYLGKKSKKPIYELSLADLVGFRSSLVASGLAPKTSNNILKYIRASLSLAVKLQHLDHNPAELIKPLPLGESGRRAFQEDELRKILAVTSGDWKTATLAGIYTGQRLGDIVSMTWESLDLESHVWRVKQAKTGKIILSPLASPLLAHLRARNKRKGYVMRRLANRATSGRKNTGGGGLSDEFGRIIERAGITRKAYREGCRRVYDVSFHSLRHTFDTLLALRGVTREERENLGIAVGRTHAVYTHFTSDHLRGLVERLPNL